MAQSIFRNHGDDALKFRLSPVLELFVKRFDVRTALNCGQGGHEQGVSQVTIPLL